MNLIYTIMLSLFVALAGISQKLHAAAAYGELPTLGNTPLADEHMSIEVNDSFVWDGDAPVIAEAQRTYKSVWEKIQDSNRMPVQLNPVIEHYKTRYLDQQWAIEKILARSAPFIGFIVERLEARGLPLDLALLPAIESGYQADVSSEDAAAGLWQIIPVTARQIGLKRTDWYDGRTDLRRSTRAALDYLSFLNAEFGGNWEHTLAAYNAGPARVKSAIKRNKESGKPVDFWSLKLPGETAAYLPKLVALIELVRQTPATPLDLPDVPASPGFTEVDIKQRISLAIAAELAGLKPRTLKRLNAGLVHAVTPPDGPHTLLVPKSVAGQLQQKIDAATSDDRVLYTLPVTHLVEAGETLSGIALKYGLEQREIREWNALEDNRIRIGEKLRLVDRRATKKPYQTPTKEDKTRISYEIQPGDTLSEIAHKHNVSMERITRTDGSKPDAARLIPGKQLLIPAVGS